MLSQSQQQSIIASQNLQTPPENLNPTVPNQLNGLVNTVWVDTAKTIKISLDKKKSNKKENDKEELDDCNMME